MVRPARHEIEAIPENLFREPVDLLYADHFRQRLVCNMVEQILDHAGSPEAAERAVAVVAYLENQLPLHVADEEEDLFPHLRTRCRPEDHVEGALSLLCQEHGEDDALAATLLDGLRTVAGGGRPPDERPFVQAAAAFVQSQRRHLAWENALILPLARKRLGLEDLIEIGRRMAARRHIPFPD